MTEQDSLGEVTMPLSPSKSPYSTGDGEASAQQQLRRVYKLLSQSFSREVSSVADVQSVIKAFVNKYIKTKEQLKSQADENEQLSMQLQQSVDQTQIDEADKEQLAANEEELVKKLKQYKRQVLGLKQQLLESNAATAEMQTLIGEVKLQLEDAQRENAKLTEELANCKNQLTKVQPQKPEGNQVEETARLFEDLVAGQAEEISELVHQREILIDTTRSLDAAVRGAEAMIQREQTTKAEADKFTQEMVKKNEVLSSALPNLAQEIEQTIPHDLRSKLPQNGADSGKYIKAVVEALIELSSASKEEEKTESVEPGIPKAQYLELLIRLEDAVRYILNIAKSGDKASDIGPLGIDSEVRNCLLTQCARIGHFVDENLLTVGVENLPQHLSLFEPGAFNSSEQQLTEFLNFVTEEQLKESPVRELFALFTSICEVNKMLMNYTENMKAKTREPERSNVAADVVRNLQRDNFDLAQWKAVNQEKLESVTSVLQKLTNDDGETALDVMAEDLGNRYAQVAQENETLKAQLQQISAEKKELEEATQASIVEAQEQIQTREITIQEEQKTREDISHELEDKVSRLSTSNDNLKQRLQSTTESYESALREKSMKLKKAILSQSETKKMLDAIQERTNTIVTENEQLHSINTEMEETLAAQKEQLDALAMNEKKLRDSRENLKKRILAAENVNKTTLADIKQRNEELQAKYTETTSKLANDLNKSKEQVDMLSEQNESIKKENAELTQVITNLRVTERALNLKLKTLQERQNTEKSSAEARNNSYMISLKAQAQRQIDESAAQLEQTRASINKILEQQFGEKPEENASFNELFTRLDRRLQMFTADKKILQDAIKLRGDLKLPPNVSICETFASEQQARNNAEKKAERSQTERRSFEQELTKLKRATEKMATDAKQANEWERWGRSLYKQVNESTKEIPLNELRSKLTENVLVAVKDRSTIRKFDSLRLQKKILANPAMSEQQKAGAELSMHSVTNILVFAQRIQGNGGTLIPLQKSPRKENTSSFH